MTALLNNVGILGTVGCCLFVCVVVILNSMEIRSSKPKTEAGGGGLLGFKCYVLTTW